MHKLGLCEFVCMQISYNVLSNMKKEGAVEELGPDEQDLMTDRMSVSFTEVLTGPRTFSIACCRSSPKSATHLPHEIDPLCFK